MQPAPRRASQGDIVASMCQPTECTRRNVARVADDTRLWAVQLKYHCAADAADTSSKQSPHTSQYGEFLTIGVADEEIYPREGDDVIEYSCGHHLHGTLTALRHGNLDVKLCEGVGTPGLGHEPHTLGRFAVKGGCGCSQVHDLDSTTQAVKAHRTTEQCSGGWRSLDGHGLDPKPGHGLQTAHCPERAIAQVGPDLENSKGTAGSGPLCGDSHLPSQLLHHAKNGLVAIWNAPRTHEVGDELAKWIEGDPIGNRDITSHAKVFSAPPSMSLRHNDLHLGCTLQTVQKHQQLEPPRSQREDLQPGKRGARPRRRQGRCAISIAEVAP
mmetsp:Transcript_86551/g.277876  ORF Transcript_86551/g.277876 Transcript_86551/m.277876 type:complete len:327 (-) Transcript_86551:53-1033(-)